jgi:hypothetical protein
MLETVSWIFAIIAVYGTYLNVKMDKTGFYYWLVSNSAFCAINLSNGQLAQGFLFGIYMILSIIGLQNWKK